MLSHLRFHRRGQSNPTSPGADQASSASPPSVNQSQYISDATSTRPHQPSSATSPLPPSLPPIPLVSTADFGERPFDVENVSNSEQRALSEYQPPYNAKSGFIGGAALDNYRRNIQTQQPQNPSGERCTIPQPEPQHYQRPPLVSSVTDVLPHVRPPPPNYPNSRPSLKYSTAPDDATQHATQRSSRGLAPSTSQASETPSYNSNTAIPIEPQKGKKSLPFLKNPMSTLLMRRKATHNAPDISSLPLRSKDDAPTYDPRIKGTRVHDFSAPRDSKGTSARSTTSNSNVSNPEGHLPLPPDQNERFHRDFPNEAGPNATSSQMSADVGALPGSIPEQGGSDANSFQRSGELNSTSQYSNNISRLQTQTVASVGHEAVSTGYREEPANNPTGTERTTRSRNVSLSSIPRHMKSTSSRFSFDMVGTTKQEMIMEEKHRQREMERRDTTQTIERDSRFDDFDDDAFDYDAMIDDDGLEERIPGVNADYDDEGEVPEIELDPDNDQANFAGFVFQRSNPTSSIASPQLNTSVPTPRDVDGNIIGTAVTKDTPTMQDFVISTGMRAASSDKTLSQQTAHLDLSNQSTIIPTPSLQPGALEMVKEDELYYDDGIIGFDDEFADDLAAEPEPGAAPFDESIFDNDDTDKFGRPLPGAFAKAQSIRQAALKEATRRESDIASQLSVHSPVSHSTAHTSLSTDIVDTAHGQNRKRSTTSASGSNIPHDLGQEQKSVAMYQAALAAAAHQAAASGKFRRNSSPLLGEEAQISEPVQNINAPAEAEQDNIFNANDYELSYEDMDDFEADDEEFIAEANACALANDADGWYGQEFGFYAAPRSQQHNTHSSNTGSTDFDYANGGFFGPKGMTDLARSASGRFISREPNLTPITERSEYSNRNSVMSMGLPILNSGTPTLQSPGLAQLAMMSEHGDDQMTLSALLKLRSRAWGGSQASHSSSREESPQSERGDAPISPWVNNPMGSMTAQVGGQLQRNSMLSIGSYESGCGSAPTSPTLTSGMVFPALLQQPGSAPKPGSSPLRGNSAPAACSSNDMQPVRSNAHQVGVPHSEPVSAISSGVASEWTWGRESLVSTRSMPTVSRHQSGRGHHRHNSSADSISYVIEEESPGEQRWVMERRRTGESGQVEILEREVVEGGRI